MSIQYHPRKANIVADDLSRKYSMALIGASLMEWQSLETCVQADIRLVSKGSNTYIASMAVQSTLISRVVEAQRSDSVICQRLANLVVNLLDDFPSDYSIGDNGGLRFCSRLCIPDIPELRR